MGTDTVVEIFYQAFSLVILLISIILVPIVIVSIIIALFQASTQINESSLIFIPKVITLFAVLIVSGHWLLNLIIDYSTNLITNIPYMIG